MADLDQPMDDVSVDSAENNQDSKSGISEDEEMLMAKMYRLLGGRWSLIDGRIPGRTAEEIEKFWNARNSSSSQ